MKQQVGQWNREQGWCSVIVCELNDEHLVIVHIDDIVTTQVVPREEYRYILLRPEADVEQAKASFKEAARRLGYHGSVESYIGAVHDESGNPSDPAAGGGTAEREGADAGDLAGAGNGPGVHQGGPEGPVPDELADLLGDGAPADEHGAELNFEDLL